MRLAPPLLCLAILGLPCAWAADDDDEKAGIAFFEQRIRPVLAARCYGCHSAEAKELEGNLYLDSKAGWEKGGDGGAAVIVPGKPEESLLVALIRHAEEGREMPPDGDKLSDSVIADFVTWIDMGAPDPRLDGKVEVKRADKNWWSLQPLARVEPPAPDDAPESPRDWRANPVDRFLLEAMKRQGLAPSPPADPRTLIRRMTYDLHGLPPTFAEVEAFAAAHARDPDAAVAALVDRLLASPRYGEKWGRHWLDVVRFGESNGYERNFVINDLWPFRDYVIRSFNDDKPFDRFIVEHLAGDVVGKDDPDVEIASAFLVAGPYDDVMNQDPVAKANIRAATLDDVVTAAGSAFLGLTINCARCHNHKFDPIPTEDYYRLRAAFEGVTHGRRVVASPAERERYAEQTDDLKKRVRELETQRAKLDARLTVRAEAELAQRSFPRPKVDARLTEEAFEPQEARHVRITFFANAGDPTGRSERDFGRLTEVEVWTADDAPRNVALASAGGRAAGARSVSAEDFPNAYGPQFVIDGRLGEQYFIGAPPVLTITLAEVERIGRLTLSNAAGGRDLIPRYRDEFPCEYRIDVSLDGERWTTVASGDDREPWSRNHGVERLKRELVTAAEREQLAALDRELAEVRGRLRKVPPLREVWAGQFRQPKEPTYVHRGGDPTKPANPVAPSSPSVLDQVTKPFSLPLDAPEGERRRRLAEWIVSPENPLTPRVLANRVWHYHFGTGIVDTPSDFGYLGGQPTHPELLDYLAGYLSDTRPGGAGWRLKPLHRLILTSQAYRQSSASREDAARIDKDARFLWRFPPRRATGEEIRDTLLAVAGVLQLEPMGGPGFRLYKFTQNNVCTYTPLDTHGPETYRRAVYHQSARASVVDVLTDFDFPDIAFAAPRRSNTTSPLQALTLLNHSFVLDMAKAFAARITAAASPVAEAYRLAYQREPTPEELEHARPFVAAHGLEAFCRALLNSSELMAID
jgi:mono/diheme cytochrome c family protein